MSYSIPEPMQVCEEQQETNIKGAGCAIKKDTWRRGRQKKNETESVMQGIQQKINQFKSKLEKLSLTLKTMIKEFEDKVRGNTSTCFFTFKNNSPLIGLLSKENEIFLDQCLTIFDYTDELFKRFNLQHVADDI